MKKRLALLPLLLALGLSGRAQQMPTYNMYAQHQYLINPAFAGYWQGINGHLYVKSMFNGLPNTPRQLDAAVHGAMPELQAAFGLRMSMDERAAFQTFQVAATAAYKLQVTREQLFSVAIDAGFVNRAFDPLAVNEFTNGGDPVLVSNYYNQTNFRFAVGAAYIAPKWEAGLAMPQLIEGGEQLIPHLTGYLAGNFFTGDLLLKPSAYVQYLPDGTVLGDVGLMAEYAQTLWLQPGFRTNKTVLLSAGFIFASAQVGYSFSLYAGEYDAYQGDAHEVVISLLMNEGGRSRSFIDRLNPYQKRGIQRLFRRR